MNNHSETKRQFPIALYVFATVLECIDFQMDRDTFGENILLLVYFENTTDVAS